ncbi:Concanavalin A-like lectin/glucanase, subgroup [Cynara cardunculus var. scolymus]|uniref:Concanavalin A-like lectin/glucanase, subgroup n=1 Tax=Cynara cardunculus var. scolymus TaxID=59895 RepID=A0A118JVL9_CYNCS|nr:Concanavalin A-like lectin/glucanase, subgroup [Cynara cardunculus var. scolymus]
MMKRQKSGTVRGGLDHVGEKVVLIAVKASKEISRNALIWALAHVVQPGDCAKLLVVIPAHTSSHKLWNFSKFNSDCTTGQWKSLSGDVRDQKDYITESCSQMMLQLHNIYDSDKASLIALKLKKEAKVCIEELECNVVVMKKSRPKVLRLNLVGSPTKEVGEGLSSCLEAPAESSKEEESIWNATKVPNVTPVSSPEHSLFSTTEHGTSSLSSLDLGFSPFLVADHDWDVKKDEFLDESDSDTDSENLSSSPSTSLCSPWMADAFSSSGEFSKMERSPKLLNERALINPITDALRLKFSELDHRLEKATKNVRETIPLRRHVPPKPPPLCSICQHKAPVFGKPPKWFTFCELEDATDGFSKANFLAEGGFGSVHRGVLKDGRMVAVKQHKMASSQGDNEFFSEVEVLSCAQHRNVVMLIGFCVEDGRRLLVYEYICNSRRFWACEVATGRRNWCGNENNWNFRARPLLEETAIAELMDPRLKQSYSEPEVLWMLENNDIK